MNMATLLWGVIFGSIGAGYLLYGKRQSAPVPLLCGLALCVFPYFVSSAGANCARPAFDGPDLTLAPGQAAAAVTSSPTTSRTHPTGA